MYKHVWAYATKCNKLSYFFYKSRCRNIDRLQHGLETWFYRKTTPHFTWLALVPDSEKSCKHWNSAPNFAYRFFRAYSTRFEWSKLSLSTFAPLSDHIYLPLKMTRIIEINSLSNILPNNTTKQNLLWLLIWFCISTWKNIFWSAKILRVVPL